MPTVRHPEQQLRHRMLGVQQPEGYMSVVPDEAELRAFIYKQVAEARRLNDQTGVDDLLDKLDNIEEMRAFLAQVLT